MFVDLSEITQQMQTINLQKIIDKQGLVPQDLAKKLFPSNRHPMMSLTRVLQGKGVLGADQISLLSSITGQSINALFDVSEWKLTSSKNVMTFAADDFEAVLDLKAFTSKIYHKGSIFHETILHSKSIPLSEYIKELDAAVSKYKS